MAHSFISSYLASGLKAGPFLPRGIGTPADRRARHAISAARAMTPAVVGAVRRQNQRFAATPERVRNLDALASPETTVVVTGQQAGLFLGPLFTLYKAASAVVLARTIERETGKRCAPIFWVASEDHDFIEIAQTFVPRKDGDPVMLSITVDQARISVSERRLSSEIEGLTETLEGLLSEQPHAREVLALVRAHYRAGARLCDAFAGLLAALFDPYGLLIFDPRDAEVAHASAPVFRTAIIEWARIETLLLERDRALEKADLIRQVTLRPGSPLVFFHPRGAAGPRFRLTARGDQKFAVLGEGGGQSSGENGEIEMSALDDLLEKDPSRFSSSALLRPIVQDSLFPTVAYVGGPAEVSYFAQIAPIYSVFGLEPPLVSPRASFRLIPRDLRRLLEKMEISPADAACAPLDLSVKLLPPDEHAPAHSWISPLESQLDALLSREPSLARAILRTKGSIAHAFGRLARKHQRLRAERDRISTDRARRVANLLHPNGGPQERCFSFPWFAARAGTAALVDRVVSACDPFDPTCKDLDLD